MARPTLEIISALRETADRMGDGVPYAWGHHGSCNCGHLVQTITHESPGKIQALAVEKLGDWSDKVIAYCPTSQFPIDQVITQMLEVGFTPDDLYALERLCDRDVLASLPEHRKPLRHNRREDAMVYMRAWADLLEAQLMGVVEEERVCVEMKF